MSTEKLNRLRAELTDLRTQRIRLEGRADAVRQEVSKLLESSTLKGLQIDANCTVDDLLLVRSDLEKQRTELEQHIVYWTQKLEEEYARFEANKRRTLEDCEQPTSVEGHNKGT